MTARCACGYGYACLNPYLERESINRMKFQAIHSRAVHRMRQLHIGINQSRLAIFAVTLIVFGVALGGLKPAQPAIGGGYTSILDLDLPARGEPSADALETSKAIPVDPLTIDGEWDLVEVQNGQSLDTIFREQGFGIFSTFEFVI